MNKLTLLALAAVAAICFMATTPTTQAQVEVNIGVAPVCPYGYYSRPAVRLRSLTATTARSGLPAASSSARAHGFMVLKASTVT